MKTPNSVAAPAIRAAAAIGREFLFTILPPTEPIPPIWALFRQHLTTMLRSAQSRSEQYIEIWANSISPPELNPIARFWYLTGALELEQKLDPKAVLQRALRSFGDGDVSA